MKIIRAGGIGAALLVCAAFASAGEYAGTEVVFKRGFDSVPVTSSRAGDVLWGSDPSEPVSEQFSSLNFQGEAAGPEVGLEVSLLAGGKWGEWVPAYVKWLPGGRFWGGFPLAGEAGSIIRLRLVSRQAGSGNITIFEINTARETGGDRYKAGKSFSGYKALELPTAVSTAKLAIVSRNDWKADPAKKLFEPMLPVRITIHHTDAVQAMTKEAAVRELLAIQDYHMSPQGRNFDDIGYQFIIDGVGNIYQGRPEIMVGAHVANNNEGNIGISLMGRFQPPSAQRPTQKQLEAMTNLTRWLVANYSIPVKNVRAHRDLDTTACPGDNLYKYMDELRRAAAAPAPDAAKVGKSLSFELPDPAVIFGVFGGL